MNQAISQQLKTASLILPKKITQESIVHLIHTSSPVEPSDFKAFRVVLGKLKKSFPKIKLFDVKKSKLDPRYLAASEKERLRKFRQARKKVDWLAPIYGGTGCIDIVRQLDNTDLAKIRKNRPVVNGFSDTTFLLLFLYFKLKLLTFHYSNVCGLSSAGQYRFWLKLISGRIDRFSFADKHAQWLSNRPTNNLEGIALGGNLSALRDLLDISNIKVKSWKPFILFVEDVGIDAEDLHHIVAALDEKGVFFHIRALVIGKIADKEIIKNYQKFNFIFRGNKKPVREKPEKIFPYLLGRVLVQRQKQKNPLPILKIENLGHGIKKDTMILPIGSKVIIYPGGKIEFVGPFVR